jgi:c-di-GMP-binding flagellar brake protein YcgR
VHTATTRVLQVMTAPYIFISVVAPTGFTTQQQREFFRVAVKLPVSCTIVESADHDAIGRQDSAAKSADISAGGMRLSTTLPLQLGDRVELQLKSGLPRVTTPRLYAQVLRVGAGETRARGVISVGLKFVYANQREQDSVMLLMYELQRKSLT